MTQNQFSVGSNPTLGIMIQKILDWTIETYSSIAQRFAAWRYRTFTPSNRLTIRNVPQSYADHAERYFHAAFTVLCNFVERERGGESQIENDISKNVAQIDRNQDNLTVAILREQVAVDRAIVELYGWYTSIDWNDPVPMSSEYRAMIDQAEFVSTPTDHNTYSLQINHPQPDAYARARAAYAVQEQQFDNIKVKKLVQLSTIHMHLWN